MSWQTPQGDPPPDPGAPAVAWALPEPPAAVAGAEGMVVAGVFRRLVGYSVDLLLLRSIDAIIAGLLGQLGDHPSASRGLIVTVVSLGVDFLYLVGSWTSPWQATLGMRLLKLRVLGARDAGTLSSSGAVLRWLVLSGGFSLVAFVPGIAQILAPLALLWLLALLLSTGMNKLHQGLHDRLAASVVVEPAPGGSGAAVLTCLVLVVFVGIVLPVIALALAGDQLRDIMSKIGTTV